MKKITFILLTFISFVSTVQSQDCTVSLKDNKTKFCSNDTLLVNSKMSATTSIANFSDSSKVIDLAKIIEPKDTAIFNGLVRSGAFLNKDLNQIITTVAAINPNLKINSVSNITNYVDLKIVNNQNLTKALITSGKLIFKFYSDLKQETTFDLEFPTLQKDGQVFKVSIKIDANELASLKNPIIKTIDLTKIFANLATDGGKIKYILKPNLYIRNKYLSSKEQVIMKIELNDFKFSSGYSYFWYKDDKIVTALNDLGSIRATESGKYKVVVKSEGLCPEMSDEIIIAKIIQPSKTLKISTEKSLCQGDTLTITSLEPSSYVYLWSDNTTKSNVFKATKSGDYFVNITNDICSVKSDIIKVVVNPKPTLKLNINKLDTTIVIGNKLTLKASGAKEYLWNNQSKLDSIVLKEAGKYSVTGKNEFGCSSSVNFELKLREKGVGLESLNTLQLSISPNPVSEILTVAVDNFKNNTLKIVDLKGNQILTQPLTDNKTEINVNSFAKGIYLVNISDNANTVLNTKRFVVE